MVAWTINGIVSPVWYSLFDVVTIAQNWSIFNAFVIEIMTENARRFEGAARPDLCFL